jgi:hypothetical protein
MNLTAESYFSGSLIVEAEVTVMSITNMSQPGVPYAVVLAASTLVWLGPRASLFAGPTSSHFFNAADTAGDLIGAGPTGCFATSAPALPAIVRAPSASVPSAVKAVTSLFVG